MKAKRIAKTAAPITPGSGNVFTDLGFRPQEAAELQVKAELARQIYRRIKSLGLTQTGAAARLGLSQPDVSKLMNGRLTGFSTDRLIALLNALEVDVEIVVRPRRRHEPGVVRVRESISAA